MAPPGAGDEFTVASELQVGADIEVGGGPWILAGELLLSSAAITVGPPARRGSYAAFPRPTCDASPA